jgi:hypothetical protein
MSIGISAVSRAAAAALAVAADMGRSRRRTGRPGGGSKVQINRPSRPVFSVLRLRAEFPAFFLVANRAVIVALGKFPALCAMPDMPSPPTLRAWIGMREDFPVACRTDRRRDWVYDLEDAAAFVRAHYVDGRAVHRRREADIQRRQMIPEPSFFDGE